MPPSDIPSVYEQRRRSQLGADVAAAVYHFLGDDVSPQHVDELYEIVRRQIANSRRENGAYQGVDR
jgi:hypothetical protein